MQDPGGERPGFAEIFCALGEPLTREPAFANRDTQFRLLVQGVRDYALYMLDPDGRVASWNTGAQKIKGYLATEIIGENFARFYTEGDQAAGEPRRTLEIAARNGRFETEAWRVRRDGSLFWAHVVVDRIRADDGALLGFAKITRDISQAKATRDALDEANRALRGLHETSMRSEARFRQVVEATPNGIMMVNAAGRIAMVNAQVEQLFGYTRAELLGAPVEMLLPQRLRASHAARREAFFAAPVPRPMGAGGALMGRHKDGREFMVEIQLSPIDTDEGPMVLAAIADISARVRLEEELRQAQKLEVLGRLAAGVSHDFNNILQVILGGVDLLKDEAPEAAGIVELVENAARRGAYLTHHLLSYSRKQTLTPKLIDLGDTLDRLRLVLSRTLASNIAVIISVAPGTGHIRVDRAQFETALMNLALNAAHAMPDGGKLSFKASPAAGPPFGEIKSGRYVAITVSDTGTGMSPEVLACAFDPFFTTKGLEGTGLGLAMVQGFCRQSGGDVRVSSTVGQGTCFELWLPEDHEPKPAAASNETIPRQAGHVLLVDDSRDVLVIVEAALRKGGFHVEHADNGRRALALLAESGPFDLLVTDYMMPDLNGVDLIRQARILAPALPALIISGYAEVTDFMTDLPNALLLQKPFQRDELLTRIRTLLADAKADSSKLS